MIRSRRPGRRTFEGIYETRAVERSKLGSGIVGLSHAARLELAFSVLRLSIEKSSLSPSTYDGGNRRRNPIAYSIRTIRTLVVITNVVKKGIP